MRPAVKSHASCMHPHAPSIWRNRHSSMPWHRSLGGPGEARGWLGHDPVTRASETGGAMGPQPDTLGSKAAQEGIREWNVAFLGRRPPEAETTRGIYLLGQTTGCQGRVGALYGRGCGGVWCYVRYSVFVVAGGWLRFSDGPGGILKRAGGSERGQPGQRGL